MIVRPFDWRDLPWLYRYRGQSIFLNSTLLLTRGPMLVQGALVSYLAPHTGIFTGVCSGGKEGTLLGQMMHAPGSQFAHLTFLTPQEALHRPLLNELLEAMVVIAGERGAFRLLADVDEGAAAFASLHQAGFAIFSRQRIWQLTGVSGKPEPSPWRPACSRDSLQIRALYNNVVPGLVQQVEPFGPQRCKGLVYQDGPDLLAYVELKFGHRGIWVQPFVHPNAEQVTERFLELIQNLPNRRSRPVYLCVRSYQSWLEPAIEELGAEAGPRQAVLVKHLALQQRAIRVFALPALEGGHPEVSAPIARSESNRKL